MDLIITGVLIGIGLYFAPVILGTVIMAGGAVLYGVCRLFGACK